MDTKEDDEDEDVMAVRSMLLHHKRKQTASSSSSSADVPAKQARKLHEPLDREDGKWKTSLFYKEYVMEKEGLTPSQEKRADKLFGLRFRIPKSFLPTFMELVYDAMPHLREQTQRRICPTVMVLACLRRLARGCMIDDLVELTNVSAGTLCEFFNEFVVAFSDKYYDTFVSSLTSTREAIDEVEAGFRALRLPGCGGAIDCTHFVWHNCPHKKLNDVKGAKHMPTLVVEMVCDSRRRILHVSDAEAGVVNDQGMSCRSTYVRQFKCDTTLIGSHPWDFFTGKLGEDEIQWLRGLWLLTDGGYARTDLFIMPLKVCCMIDPLEADYSGWLETVRKFIECVFGILKKRFSILCYPLRMC